MRRSAVVVLWACLASAPAWGQGAPPPASPVEQSRQHHRNAVVHFNLDEWKQAADEFKEAYRLHPDPLFLYNIAQCYRKLGDHAEALSYYRKYLRAAPKASNRAEVERRIDELEAALAASSKAREAPPPSVLLPSPEPTAPPPVESTGAAPPPTAAVAPAPPVSVVTAEAPAAEPPPVYKRWWFWAGVGAVVATGVVIGIVASSPHTRAGTVGDLPPGRIAVPGR
jgi:tetratricopeptide (TPR) repeat protein